MASTILERIKAHPEVDSYADERDLGDGVWIYLKVRKGGYCWDDHGLHTIHEDTWKQAYSCLLSIMRCNCKECKEKQ